MENILIISDFSEASRNAGKYGVSFAKQFHAKIKLLHVYQKPVEIPESYLLYPIEQLSEQAMALLNKEAALIDESGQAAIETCVAGGVISDTILSEARRLHADIIICGMKGAGTVLKRIFGSTATELIRRSTIPLLIVPDGLTFQIPANILFASDMKTVPAGPNVEFLKIIGEAFKSKLSVVTVAGDHYIDPADLQLYFSDFVKALKTLHPDLQLLPGDDIGLVLDKFVLENKVGLITMVPHHHRFFERLFHESITREMAFITSVPLLTLPEDLPV